MDGVISRALFVYELARNVNLLLHLCHSHKLLTDLLNELVKSPGWVNGRFDIAGKMPNIENEEEIITLFAVDVLNEYKERFLVFNTE